MLLLLRLVIIAGFVANGESFAARLLHNALQRRVDHPHYCRMELEEEGAASFLDSVDEFLHSVAVSHRLQTQPTEWLDSIVSDIHKEFSRDIVKYAWFDGSDNGTQTQQVCESVDVEWIYLGDGRRLALQTKEPILSDSTIDLLRQVANSFWEQGQLEGEALPPSSSFTYQRKGNREVHLGDLCTFNETLRVAMQDALKTNIFPVVQDHYFETGDWIPRIYDSLFIRYNASAASEGSMGAGQPLHRDLGVASVNLMLNDASEFDGGGTFFEDQLHEDGDEITAAPLKPSRRRGNALVHGSNIRHAGAGTVNGVRDILVLFLSAINQHEEEGSSIHPVELGARIKEKSKTLIQNQQENLDLLEVEMKRAILYRTAIGAVSTDGEAYHYLGTCLHSLAGALRQKGGSGIELCVEKSAVADQLAIGALERAANLIPNDARLFNNIGLILGKQEGRDEAQVERCYQWSLGVHERCLAVNCYVQTDLESTALNYGLFLANQDCWEEAIDVLDKIGDSSDCVDEASMRLRSDAYRLRQFCAAQRHQSLAASPSVPRGKDVYNKIRNWMR